MEVRETRDLSSSKPFVLGAEQVVVAFVAVGMWWVFYFCT